MRSNSSRPRMAARFMPNTLVRNYREGTIMRFDDLNIPVYMYGYGKSFHAPKGVLSLECPLNLFQ